MNCLNKTFNKGFTLLELGLVVGIMATIFIGVGIFISDVSEDNKYKNIALSIRQVGEAAQRYINSNSASLISAASATEPAVIPVSVLTANNPGLTFNQYLGQQLCVLVLQPTTGYLQAMVVTEGGEPINDIALGGIMRTLGANGGGIYSSDVNNIVGAQGGWSIPIGNFANSKVKCSDGSTSGSVKLEKGHPVYALWFKTSSTGVNTQVLYRNNVAGHPELATMNTPIIMNAVQSLGSSCNTQGAIANLNDGTPVSCSSGKWLRTVGTLAPKSCFDVEQDGKTKMLCGKVNIENSSGSGTVKLVDNAGNSTHLQTYNGKLRVLNNDKTQELFNIEQSGNVFAKGNITTSGGITASGNVQTTGYFVPKNNSWGLVTHNSSGVQYSARRNPTASIHINDMYIRSIGKWASEVDDLAKAAMVEAKKKGGGGGVSRTHRSCSGKSSCSMNLQKGKYSLNIRLSTSPGSGKSEYVSQYKGRVLASGVASAWVTNHYTLCPCIRYEVDEGRYCSSSKCRYCRCNPKTYHYNANINVVKDGRVTFSQQAYKRYGRSRYPRYNNSFISNVTVNANPT